MPVCATRLALLLLLAGGCGRDATWSTSFEFAPATPEAGLSVAAWRGKVRLRNSASGRVEITVRGDAPLPLDKAVTVQVAREITVAEGGRPQASVRIDPAAKDADLELEIAAPAGISLSCACSDADVEVTGAWARLEIRTARGAIAARVERADSGILESQGGRVDFAAAPKGPTGDFTAKSASGDVTVHLPAPWNGQVHFGTQTGKLDVPPHAGFRSKWDEDGKGVVGHVGPPRQKGAPLATVWGTSATGLVTFRLGE